MAGAILGLACLDGGLATGTGRPCCTALRRPCSTDEGTVGTLDARRRQESLDQVRAHLTQDQFDQAYANGMALSLDHALDLASGKASHADHST